jgi:hypothetical protein
VKNQKKEYIRLYLFFKTLPAYFKIDQVLSMNTQKSTGLYSPQRTKCTRERKSFSFCNFDKREKEVCLFLSIHYTLDSYFDWLVYNGGVSDGLMMS